jgi:hypothetical protein
MFLSRRRSVVFPQADHARFAGALALAWRERPPVPFASFIRGVADHDVATASTTPMRSVERWEASAGSASNAEEFTRRGEDVVVDLVVALHVRRLLSSQEDEHERAAYAEVDRLDPTAAPHGRRHTAGCRVSRRDHEPL